MCSFKIRISHSISVQNCDLSQIFSKNKEGLPALKVFHWKRKKSEYSPRIVSGLGLFLPLMWDQAAAICAARFPAEYHSFGQVALLIPVSGTEEKV